MIEDSRFYEIEPTLENYWRAIILFGRNVASYKFALAKSLYDFRNHSREFIRMDELAPVFAKHIAGHLKQCNKQATSSQSRFLDVCRSYNAGKINESKLAEETIRLGFQNVIDAFHNVHGKETPTRFFLDERKTNNGIQITDQFLTLVENPVLEDLNIETEARWRLVETAWDLGVSKHIVQVTYDKTSEFLYAQTEQKRRVAVTSSRNALNGYQKGRCFYCFRNMHINIDSNEQAEVDHFFPYKLNYCSIDKPINGVANLVLACKDCNRGAGGKFDRLPDLSLLERLHHRNEYLIKSYHPLRETLIVQTGLTEQNRQSYLQEVYNCAKSTISMNWRPVTCGDAVF